MDDMIVAAKSGTAQAHPQFRRVDAKHYLRNEKGEMVELERSWPGNETNTPWYRGDGANGRQRHKPVQPQYKPSCGIFDGEQRPLLSEAASRAPLPANRHRRLWRHR